MRIAINAWFLGQMGTGSGQYLENLLKALSRCAPQHRFLLVTAPGAPRFEAAVLKAEVWHCRNSFWRSNPGKVLFEQVVFPQICHRWGADVAHVPYWGSPLWPSVPTVVTIHDLIPLLLPAYRGSRLVRLYTRLVSASARKATLVITDSEASKRDIVTYLRLPPERVRCIYLGIGEQFSPEPAPHDEVVRAIYELPQRYVLYLAGHDERKNVAGLVEAFATVSQADDDVTLVVGGRLPEEKRAPFFDPRPLVKALGIAQDVRFLGWVDESDKPALYRGAACAVFPSLYEGFGLPILEALASGTPLVASSASSLPELVGDAGFVVEPGDVAALAGAIVACLVDDHLAAELSRRGPRQAAKFCWGRTAQETAAVYEAAAVSQGA